MIDRIILFPYTLALAAKNWLYRSGIKKARTAEVPTVSVGNITVGGTGKTPHTEMILRTLLGNAGWHGRPVAVLSRGYKRRSRGFQVVTPDGTAHFYGDEPLQIAKKFPQVTVAVDKDRIEGCRFLARPDLLQTSKKARKCRFKDIPAAEAVILDDAFQYRRLAATVNILLVDFNRPITKDRLLPIGRLRDLPSRIHDADIVIVTKCPGYLNEWEKGKWAAQLGIEGYNTASCQGRDKDGKVQTLLFTSIGYGQMAPVFPEGDPRYIYSKRLVLFSGIAKDKPLRSYLYDHYRIVSHFSFPDHHRYSRGDVHTIYGAARQYPTAVVATTEKDAQRIADAKKVPPALKERLFYIPIEVHFLTDNEREVFEATLLASLRGSRSGS